MNSSKPETVLVAGWGGMARKHIDALKSLGFAGHLVSLKDVSWEDVARLRPSFALITSPTSAHVAQGLRLARLGIPFLMEKPVSSHARGLEALLTTVRKKKLTTYVACQLRFDPLIIAAGHYIRREKPHRIRVHCHSYLPHWRPGRDLRETYSAQKHLGGGVAYDLIHEFDYLYSWLGRPRKVAGFARRLSRLPIDAADTCAAVLDYPDTLAEVSLGYADKNPSRGFELFYENKILRGDLLTGKWIEEKSGKKRLLARFPRSPKRLLEAQMAHFLVCLKGHKKTLNTVADGAQVLRVVRALEGA